MILNYAIPSIFFSNIISELNVSKNHHCFLNDINSDSVLSVLNVFENHPSIMNIKRKKFNSTFSFENTCVIKVISNLNIAKTCQINDIHTTIIKMKIFFADFITGKCNYCIAYSELLMVKNTLMLYLSTKRMKLVTRQITD